MGISPYISEGSGLKLARHFTPLKEKSISPYISEGSGLKLNAEAAEVEIGDYLPLHQ